MKPYCNRCKYCSIVMNCLPFCHMIYWQKLSQRTIKQAFFIDYLFIQITSDSYLGSTFHLRNKLPNTRVSAPPPWGISAPHPGGYSYKFPHSCHCARRINILLAAKFSRKFQEKTIEGVLPSTLNLANLF